MFGLVPKPIWSKLVTPDERNGIPQNANSLLVELDDGRRGIIDAGCGNPVRFDDKALSRARTPHDLVSGNRAARPRAAAQGPRQSLHPPALGPCLRRDRNGGRGPLPGHPVLCPRLGVGRRHQWQSLLYKAYPGDAIQPLRRHTRTTLVKGEEHQILPGVTLVRSGGHTRGHATYWFHSPNLVVLRLPRRRRARPGQPGPLHRRRLSLPAPPAHGLPGRLRHLPRWTPAPGSGNGSPIARPRASPCFSATIPTSRAG